MIGDDCINMAGPEIKVKPLIWFESSPSPSLPYGTNISYLIAFCILIVSYVDIDIGCDRGLALGYLLCMCIPKNTTNISKLVKSYFPSKMRDVDWLNTTILPFILLSLLFYIYIH